MKLNNLILQESFDTNFQHNLERAFAHMGDEIADSTIEVLTKSTAQCLEKYFKGMKVIKDIDQTAHDIIHFEISNSIFDISIAIDLAFEGISSINFVFYANANHTLSEPGFEDSQKSITQFSAYGIYASSTDTLEQLFKVGKQTLDELMEWYFDVSGKYGPIKILVTHEDPITSSSNSRYTNLFAIGGQCMVFNNASREFDIESPIQVIKKAEVF